MDNYSIDRKSKLYIAYQWVIDNI